MAGILCAGDLFWDRRDDQGKSTGLVHMGNATSFSITEASSIKERTSKQVASYGQVLDSVPIKGASKIAITLDELNKANLALIHLGEEAVKSIEAATGKTKIFDLSKIETDVFYEIGAKLITVASVKIDTADMIYSERSITTIQIDNVNGVCSFYKNSAFQFSISSEWKPNPAIFEIGYLLIGAGVSPFAYNAPIGIEQETYIDMFEIILFDCMFPEEKRILMEQDLKKKWGI